MSNKWRTSLTEANAVFERYSVSPSDVSEETLSRKWTGIDRSVVQSLVATLRATKTVTDPKADGQTYSGTWNVGQIEVANDDGGNLAGSATIIEPLKKNLYTFASPDNLTIVRSRAYPFEQNENSWMYYEQFKSEVTKRWHNIAADNIEDEYDKINKIIDFDAYPELDTYKDFYKIGYSLTSVLLHGSGTGPTWGRVTVPKTYYEPTISSTGGLWYITDMVLISNPVIRECWYESNPDGTYNLFRTLETTTTTAIMRTRPLQYAGMILVQGYPALDDTVLTLAGFENETETIYKNARLRIGGDTYRVLGDSTAVGGVVTIDVTPAITQATEDLCDAEFNQVQAFFEAL